MLLHAFHVAQYGHQKILTRAVDTDVLVLAVSMDQCLQPEDELWVAFGTGKGFRYEVSAGLGPEKARALTGCNTVSSFAGHRKKNTWAEWNVLPELTETFICTRRCSTHH